MFRLKPIVLVIFCLLIACGRKGTSRIPAAGSDGGSGVEDAASRDAASADAGPEVDTMLRHELRPSETDPALVGGRFDEPHLAWMKPAGPSNGRLFLFLPGSFAKPSHYESVQRSAAAAGYRALGLEYPNEPLVAQTCAGRPAVCYENVRLEIITGADESPLIQIGRPDSIENRLIKALTALDERHSSEGWGEFLDGGAVRWDRIAVGGHSQGGGHAGLIAREHELARVVTLSSPVDNVDGTPAPWLAATFRTPGDRFYGFIHTEEDSYAAVVAGWTLIGVPGDGATNIEALAPPFGGSHRLATSVPGVAGLDPDHGSTGADGAAPKDEDGLPIYLDVWAYLIGG